MILQKLKILFAAIITHITYLAMANKCSGEISSSSEINPREIGQNWIREKNMQETESRKN